MKNLNYKGLGFAIALSLGFIGCDGGSGGGIVVSAGVTGIFADNPVTGLNYSCSSGLVGTVNSSGQYTCMIDDNVTFKIDSLTVLDTVATTVPLFGARPVAATDISTATKFASPTGSGDGTIDNPYDLQTALDSLVAGDVLFLRGGTYTIGTTGLLITSKVGTEQNPIIVESYPNEVAILDGKNRVPEDVINNTYPTDKGLYLNDSEYVYIRKLEITGMSENGVLVKGSYNRVQGCTIHYNFLNGILLTNREFETLPYVDGWNLIEDNLINNNSDADISNDNVHNYGDNADGIFISSGQFNVARHNTVQNNSDDGIDTWKSNDSLVEYNVVSGNGLGLLGNGNGLKLGGELNVSIPSGLRANALYNLIYDNKSAALSGNAGRLQEVAFNMSWNNQWAVSNFTDISLSNVHDNISYKDLGIVENGSPDDSWYTNNSWN